MPSASACSWTCARLRSAVSSSCISACAYLRTFWLLTMEPVGESTEADAQEEEDDEEQEDEGGEEQRSERGGHVDPSGEERRWLGQI